MPINVYLPPANDDAFDASASEYARWLRAETARLESELAKMTATPDLATLRALYPVASGSLTVAEMVEAETYAHRWWNYLPAEELTIEALRAMHEQSARIMDTPIKRAAFALLLAMVSESEG